MRQRDLPEALLKTLVVVSWLFAFVGYLMFLLVILLPVFLISPKLTERLLGGLGWTWDRYAEADRRATQ